MFSGVFARHSEFDWQGKLRYFVAVCLYCVLKEIHGVGGGREVVVGVCG